MKIEKFCHMIMSVHVYSQPPPRLLHICTVLQLTSSLISALLNHYAGDVGVSDSLSARLLEATPTLFSQDDAIASKAQELVIRATGSKNKYEQLGLLRESVKVNLTHL